MGDLSARPGPEPAPGRGPAPGSGYVWGRGAESSGQGAGTAGLELGARSKGSEEARERGTRQRLLERPGTQRPG